MSTSERYGEIIRSLKIGQLLQRVGCTAGDSEREVHHRGRTHGDGVGSSFGGLMIGKVTI